MAASTTVIFVPGAWHSPKGFTAVAEHLQQAGYKTDFVNLASVGPTKHLDSFDPDVAVIREHIAKAVAAGQKVVLVVHSYGGIPTCEAAKAFTGGQITHLFFLASFILPEGGSLIAALGGNDLPWFKVSEDRTEFNPDTPEAIFYNDMSPEAAAKATSELKPHSYKTLYSPLTYAAWKHIPSTYLYCAQDAAIPLPVQKMMVEETAKGYPIRTEELDASHSPFLSQPKQTAEAIKRAIEA